MIDDAPAPTAVHSRPPRRRPAARMFDGMVAIIVVLGGVVALLTLALASAIAVVFGLGWAVLAVAAAVLLTGVIWLHESHPGLVLLPVGALVLPAGAALALHLSLPRRIGNAVVTPTAVSSRGARFANAAGVLLVDLRRYPFAARGEVVKLRIDGGLGRTIVALPAGRCVALRVHYVGREGVLHGIAQALGANAAPALSVYGQGEPAGSGSVGVALARNRPTVSIDYRYEGGTLDVRDYPGSIDPRSWSDWPGQVVPESRPTRADSAGDYRSALAEWRQIEKNNRQIARLARNPCDRAR